MDRKRTVKDLPEQERPCERCLTLGPAVLSDAELLAVVLKTGTREKTAIELAREIMALDDHYHGLAGIHTISFDRLMEVKGVGKMKAAQILCLGEIAMRISRSRAKERLEFHNPSTIADYFMEEVRYLSREEVRLLLFDGKHSLIREAKISIGTVNAALSSPREIFLEALRFQAVYVIMVHNHPSGDPTPSRQDQLMTKRVAEAGQMIGIELSDHIIIGNQKYYSFREDGFFS